MSAERASGIRIVARALSAAGFAALSLLHVIWATGSSWPAKNASQLSEAVVGQKGRVPGPMPTALVGVATAAVSVFAAVQGGRTWISRLVLRSAAVIMLLRGAFGGDAALAALGLPPAGERFLRLDRRYYRPFALKMAVSLWIASRRGTAKPREKAASLRETVSPPVA